MTTAAPMAISHTYDAISGEHGDNGVDATVVLSADPHEGIQLGINSPFGQVTVVIGLQELLRISLDAMAMFKQLAQD